MCCIECGFDIFGGATSTLQERLAGNRAGVFKVLALDRGYPSSADVVVVTRFIVGYGAGGVWVGIGGHDPAPSIEYKLVFGDIHHFRGRWVAATLQPRSRTCQEPKRCSVAVTTARRGLSGGKICNASIQASTSLDASLRDRKSTRLNSSHVSISYAVFCLKKKNM